MTDYSPETRPLHNPNIDVPRLFRDLEITDADIRDIAALNIPSEIRVPSKSPIKTSTVDDALRIVHPGREFNVIGIKVPSGVDEQPLGQTTIDGSSNRLHNGIEAREQVAPGEISMVGWFSIENGLFRINDNGQDTTEAIAVNEEAIQNTAGADLHPYFDPDAEYEDRAVVAVKLPGYPTIVQISPSSEAVHFPKSAVVAAYEADGGLVENTAGSQLKELGLVEDKQNPHTELTAERAGGPLPRQDQMARVIIRSLVQLARESGNPR